MERYVAGFLFAGNYVLLIKKARPAWQAGRWNAIGGHIEKGESEVVAMDREFTEETGYAGPIAWYPFCVLIGHGFEVTFFFANTVLEVLVEIANMRKKEMEEYTSTWRIQDINTHYMIPNLTWLIPMARSMGKSISPHKETYFRIHEHYEEVEI